MDNATYDALQLSPTHTNETYSTLATLPIATKNNQLSYEEQRKTTINESKGKEVKQENSKGTPNKTRLIVFLIVMMVILLLITLVSIALSIATISRLNSEQSSVPSQLDNINNDTISVLDCFSASVQSNCGPGLWWRVAYLNMTDPSQQCPPVWREYNTSGVRACGRPTSSSDIDGSCLAVYYFTGRQYSRVCGRVVGYQVASPDAFRENHLDGITITHGAQRYHIWSYVAGLTEGSSNYRGSNCPCSTVPGNEPPIFIGDSYYCESGNPDDNFVHGQVYSSDPLRDGQQCEGTCLLYTSPSPRDATLSRMPSSA